MVGRLSGQILAKSFPRAAFTCHLGLEIAPDATRCRSPIAGRAESMKPGHVFPLEDFCPYKVKTSPVKLIILPPRAERPLSAPACWGATSDSDASGKALLSRRRGKRCTCMVLTHPLGRGISLMPRVVLVGALGRKDLHRALENGSAILHRTLSAETGGVS